MIYVSFSILCYNFTMKRILIFFIFLFITSCIGKNTKIRYISENDIILAFGDSITHGVGANDTESYPYVLANLTKRRVIESGVPGETTEEGVMRLKEVLEKYNPSLIILCEGGNDMLRRIDDYKIKENLRSMVRMIKEKDIDVILIGVPKPGFVISVPNFYKEVAKEFNIPYEGKILKEILTNNSLKADPIHPNNKGYEKLAKRIYELIRENGGL